MKAPYARTSAEAHLYMKRHPCACGEQQFIAHSAVVADGDKLLSRYAGPCARCGMQRKFHFTLPDEIPPIPGEGVSFGGAEPSQLLDAGEWLAVADEHTKRNPATPKDLQTAIAAMQEVLKLLPAGAEEAPDSSFWTERGRAIRDAEPGRFRRARLEAVLAAYRGERLAPNRERYPLPLLIEVFAQAVVEQGGLSGDEGRRHASELGARVQSLVKTFQLEMAEERQRKSTSSEIEQLLDGIAQTGTTAGILVGEHRAAISEAFRGVDLSRMADGMGILTAWLRNPEAAEALMHELLDQLNAAMGDKQSKP